MLDFSAAFRKIKNGKYHFFPGSVFSKKAYIVTYKEKEMITNIAMDSFQKITFVTLPGVVFSLINMWGFIFFMISMLFFVVIQQKINIKKIIGDRKLVITEPLGFFNQIHRKSDEMTMDDFKRFSYVFFVSLGWLLYIIFTVYIKKKYIFIIILPFLIFGIFLIFMYMALYLKRKWIEKRQSL